MGDITPVKILIVAVIALVVLGPERLPEMMRKAGKAWSDFRSFRETMANQVRDTVGDVPGFSELTKLTQMTSGGLKSSIASSVSAAMSSPATSTSPSTTTTSMSTSPAPTPSLPSEPVADPALARPAVAPIDPASLVATGGAIPAVGGTEQGSAIPAVGGTEQGSLVVVAPTPLVVPEPALSTVGTSRPDLGAVPQRNGTRPGSPYPGSAEPVFAADDPSFN